MRNSTICLISAVICFAVGAIIFMLALFARMFDPKTAGGIGLAFIFAFFILSMIVIPLRNREMAEEKK